MSEPIFTRPKDPADAEIRLAALEAERDALKRENDEWKAARDRVRASFNHRDENDDCQCVYCAGEVDGLSVHATEYELKWLDECQKREQAEKRMHDLEAALDDIAKLSAKWRDQEPTGFLKGTNDTVESGPSMFRRKALQDCADELDACLRSIRGSDPRLGSIPPPRSRQTDERSRLRHCS